MGGNETIRGALVKKRCSNTDMQRTRSAPAHAPALPLQHRPSRRAQRARETSDSFVSIATTRAGKAMLSRGLSGGNPEHPSGRRTILESSSITLSACVLPHAARHEHECGQIEI